MASGERKSSDDAKNAIENGDKLSENHSNDTSEQSGWLYKRTRLSHKWKKKWVVLKNNELHYGDQEGVS